MLYEVGRYKDRETYLAESLEVVNTLKKMVWELLTISRLDTPGYVCNQCNFDFGRLINERLAVYEDLFMQRELTLEKFLSPEIYISGDMRLLEKVLDNLLSNAAAYSPVENYVLIKLWKEAETVNLTIENTGIHILEEEIPKLFEAFYRVDRSRRRQAFQPSVFFSAFCVSSHKNHISFKFNPNDCSFVSFMYIDRLCRKDR